MADHNPTEVAAIVKKAREDSGLSQRKFAALIGWPQPRLSRRESGDVELRYSELQTIAGALGYANVDALLARDSATERRTA